MVQQPASNGMKLETPVTYRIRVQGHLADSWSEDLSGMVITRAYTQKNEPVTILVGHLVDQAALSGVLKPLLRMLEPYRSARWIPAINTNKGGKKMKTIQHILAVAMVLLLGAMAAPAAPEVITDKAGTTALEIKNQ